VLDGIDQCPNTPPGTPVDSVGCSAAQRAAKAALPRQPSAAPPRPAPAAPAPAAQPTPPRPETPKPTPPSAAAVAGGARKFVLRDNGFAAGSARLRPAAHATLDSVAAALAADPALRVEIGAHTAPSRSEVDTRGFASLRVEAVRSYLISKGVSPQRLVPKVYGPSEPLTADTSATGRAINRRIEITPVPAGP
jgi:OOP family OmpA-OmpF porin